MDKPGYPVHNEATIQGKVASEHNIINLNYGTQPSPQPPSTPAWNIPYLRNPLFTGREDLLQHLHDNLTHNKAATLTQAISGLGGIGKTQTAIEYAYRHRDDYRYVLWVNAATRDTIITSFLELATLLKLPERHEQDQNILVAAIKAWFATYDGWWLLIFDNTDNLLLVEDFLPPGGKGHLLLTTRAQAAGTLANAIQVEKLDLQEGMLLLLRRARVLPSDAPLDRASTADRAAAEAIVQEMDGLPLALDQAGAYIEETHSSLSSYLHRYRKHQPAYLHRRGGTGKQHPEPVAKTWSLSFQRVEKLNPPAADLLRFCAFLAPDAIPEQLILDSASKLGPRLKGIANDASLLDEAISTLFRFSLVKRNRDETTLSVHRLVQAVLRNSMDTQTQQRWAERTIRAINHAFPDAKDYRNWPRSQRYLPHAQACVTLIIAWQFAFPEAGRLLNQVGYYLDNHAQYAEAELLFKQAIAIGERVLGPEHPTLAIRLNNLANLYLNHGKYTEAEPLYQRAIAIDEKASGPEHPTLAARLNNLATLYTKQGKYTEAESLYRRAIAIDKQALGPEHPHLAKDLNNLATLYTNQGKYTEAEPLYRRAIAIGEQKLGPEHPTLATRLNNLALLYWNQGKYTEAEPLYQQAIAIDEKALGLEHPHLARDLDNLALLYWNQGKYTEAEPLFKRAIAIHEKALRPEHPNLAIRLNNLASLYTNQGKYAEAEPLYQRAIAIYEKTLGPEHPYLATSLNNLALLYKSQGNYAEAEPLYQRALAINEKALGPEHPNTITFRENYAALLKRQ